MNMVVHHKSDAHTCTSALGPDQSHEQIKTNKKVALTHSLREYTRLLPSTCMHNKQMELRAHNQ